MIAPGGRLKPEELVYIDECWKSGSFVNEIQGPANATLAVSKMSSEIHTLKSELSELRQAAAKANIILAERGEFGWAEAFGHLNKALCSCSDG